MFILKHLCILAAASYQCSLSKKTEYFFVKTSEKFNELLEATLKTEI